MSKAKYRSGSWKKKKVRRGKETKTVYERKKKNNPHCKCGKPLPGVQNKGNKTQKRSNRPYGGELCSKCFRELMIQKARSGK